MPRQVDWRLPGLLLGSQPLFLHGEALSHLLTGSFHQDTIVGRSPCVSLPQDHPGSQAHQSPYPRDFAIGFERLLGSEFEKGYTVAETKPHPQRAGELRVITPAGPEELTLQALSPEQRDYRVFIDRL